MKIGMMELVVVFIVALLVIGPDKLPEYAKKLGKALKEFRKVSESVTSEIREDIIDPLNDATAPVREAFEPITDLSKDIKSDIDGIKKDFTDITKPKPVKKEDKAKEESAEEKAEEAAEETAEEEATEEAAEETTEETTEEVEEAEETTEAATEETTEAEEPKVDDIGELKAKIETLEETITAIVSRLDAKDDKKPDFGVEGHADETDHESGESETERTRKKYWAM